MWFLIIFGLACICRVFVWFMDKATKGGIEAVDEEAFEAYQHHHQRSDGQD